MAVKGLSDTNNLITVQLPLNLGTSFFLSVSKSNLIIGVLSLPSVHLVYVRHTDTCLMEWYTLTKLQRSELSLPPCNLLLISKC